jgi:hypothetical protein
MNEDDRQWWESEQQFINEVDYVKKTLGDLSKAQLLELAAITLVINNELFESSSAMTNAYKDFTNNWNLYTRCDISSRELAEMAAALEVISLTWYSLPDALKVLVNKVQSTTRRKNAVEAAHTLHSNSDKGKAKKFVESCWKEWEQTPEKYADATAFARDMLDKFPDVLTSEVVVTRWVRNWRKKLKGQ